MHPDTSALAGPDHTVIAAMIGGLATITAALIGALAARLRKIERRIDGLRNGTHSEAVAAIAELQRERELRRLRGLPTRRAADRIVEGVDRGVH